MCTESTHSDGQTDKFGRSISGASTEGSILWQPVVEAYRRNIPWATQNFLEIVTPSITRVWKLDCGYVQTPCLKYGWDDGLPFIPPNE
ncbi:unnamed protein product [Aspergillus oryzae]|uniref:Unnamed protein product n=2 Tax=Aspergillus oryzae TaxID=5062 RepID=A0AAN4YXR0_ASPOZ|nr:unnamed protein product [Aspergillus oryzae]GMF86272.1 unnamed protein product [Aspergillus oryzae]GMG17321.1 unnamed protein product [Aspergillus oryzae]GMG38917.1 unnamed protein product [Aspergillus oryzae]GMG52744.1 unnamed protein product [Aspergillus oryzae var. brunneus]